MQKLFNIYKKYCNIKNFKLDITNISKGKIGWSKIEFIVKGKTAYKDFLFEAGGHRFQRIPETEKRGRWQTSTVTVSVLEVIDKQEISINKKDLEITYFNGEGGGGQYRNKVATSVRIKHKPTGIMAVCQEERSKERNKKKAYEVLIARINNVKSTNLRKSRSKKKKEQVGTGQRGDKIRTFRFQNEIVTDHRNGKKANLNDILAGYLDLLKS